MHLILIASPDNFLLIPSPWLYMLVEQSPQVVLSHDEQTCLLVRREKGVEQREQRGGRAFKAVDFDFDLDLDAEADLDF